MPWAEEGGLRVVRLEMFVGLVVLGKGKLSSYSLTAGDLSDPKHHRGSLSLGYESEPPASDAERRGARDRE